MSLESSELKTIKTHGGQRYDKENLYEKEKIFIIQNA